MKFEWRFQGRADRFYPHLAEELVEVGLYDVSFGIESASTKILKQMGKNIDIERARQNLKLLPSELDTHASFIVGMPAESHETINQTLDFINVTGLKHVNGGILTLFPGTTLYDTAKADGLIKDEEAYCDNLGPVYSFPILISLLIQMNN